MSSNHIPTLDGWRAVAISLVLLGHGSDEIARAAAACGLRLEIPHEIGLLGVQVFFALSGYLITTNLLVEESERGAVSLGDFYLRRVFRILPAALFFLLTVALLMSCGVLNIAPSRWWATLGFLANYTSAPGSWYVGHFWSLAIEEHFYLVWPALFILLARNERRLAFVLAAVLVVWAWRAVAFKYRLTWTEPAVFWGRSDLQADGILCGVALALARRLPRLRAELDRAMASLYAAPVLLVLLAATYLLAEYGWKSAMAATYLRSVILPLMLLATVLRSQGLAGRMLELSPFRWLGKVSYSLYLWQQLFLVWGAGSVLQSFPLGLVCAVLAAWASYRLVERPMIAQGALWRNTATRRSLIRTP